MTSVQVSVGTVTGYCPVCLNTRFVQLAARFQTTYECRECGATTNRGRLLVQISRKVKRQSQQAMARSRKILDAALKTVRPAPA
jgi:hypothetical protein